MNKIETIRQTYQSNVQQAELKLNKIKQRILLVSVMRVLLFFSFGVTLYSYFSFDRMSSLLLLSALLLLLFLILLKVHGRLFVQKGHLEKMIKINNEECLALDYNFSSFENGKEFINSQHDYSFDLDLFGERSLFQSINRTSTSFGKERLAHWFNHHLDDKLPIENRQVAVKELTQCLPLRQRFRMLGMYCHKEAFRESLIADWLAAPACFKGSKFNRALLYLVPTLNLLFLGLALLNLLSWNFLGFSFLLFFLLSTKYTRAITKLDADYNEKLAILQSYVPLFSEIEKSTFDSPFLSTLQQRLSNPQASKAIGDLSHLIHCLNQRNNMIVAALLNGGLFWELRVAIAIEKWKVQYGDYLVDWFNVVGEFDAYCSLANFAYNHPDYIYPSIVQDSFVFSGKALGHPLIHRSKCVRNDIDIVTVPAFNIVTGANMAGKSTYLRTLGVNYLLSMIGAPVCATELSISPHHIVTSLRTTDSLVDNESYFFSELKRLKMIIDRLKSGEKLFIVLDEILKGTNSKDKQKGSLALIEQFIALKTNGIIATHDLVLGELENNYPQYIKNYCFEADIRNDELTFSYQLRQGVAQNMNACFLMRKMGIAVPL